MWCGHSPILHHFHAKHRGQGSSRKDPMLHVLHPPILSTSSMILKSLFRNLALIPLCHGSTYHKAVMAYDPLNRTVPAEKKQFKCMILPHNHSQTMKQPAGNMTMGCYKRHYPDGGINISIHTIKIQDNVSLSFPNTNPKSLLHGAY